MLLLSTLVQQMHLPRQWTALLLSALVLYALMVFRARFMQEATTDGVDPSPMDPIPVRRRKTGHRLIPALPTFTPLLGNFPQFVSMHSAKAFGRMLPVLLQRHGTWETGFGIMGLNLYIPLLWRKIVVLGDPQYVRAVLVAKTDVCGKPPTYGCMKWLLGDGLITADGELWHRERRKLNGSMTGSALRRMALVCDRHAKDAVAWYAQTVADKEGDDEEAALFEPSRRMMGVTLDILLESAFGLADANAKRGAKSAVSDAVSAIMVEMIKRLTDPPMQFLRDRMVQKRWATVGPHYNVLCEQVEEVVRRRLEERQNQQDQDRANDLLDAILDAMYGHMNESSAESSGDAADGEPAADSFNIDSWTSDEGARVASAVSTARGDEPEAEADDAAPASESKVLKKQVFDHLVTFLVAGHETTSGLLAWLLLHLCEHEDIQQRVREEVNRVLDAAAEEQQQGTGGQAADVEITYEVASRMVFLRNAIKETLRITPSVATFGRDMLKPLIIARQPTVCEQHLAETGQRGPPQRSSFALGPGYGAMISVRTIHNNPLYWHQPEVFNPDRWDKPYEPVPGNEDGAVNRHPFQFIPFAAGPRNCIGQSFALVEATVIAARLIRAFKFTLVERPPGDKVYFESITSRPDGVRLRLSAVE